MSESVGPEYTLSPEKRALDIAVASAVAPIAMVGVGVASAAIRRIDDMSPMLAQPRVGLGMEEFNFYKLRTMPEATPLTPTLGKGDDPRATRFGSRLRRTHLDEMPQIYNVLRGDMSAIGPRPLISSEVNQTLDVLTPQEQKAYIRAFDTTKPGITSRFSLGAVVDTSSETFMRERALAHIEYANTATLTSDVSLFVDSILSAAQGISRHGEIRGYRNAAKLMQQVATGLNLDVTPHQAAYWRIVFGSLRALDDEVDISGVENVRPHIQKLLSGVPIGNMTQKHADEFKETFRHASEAQQQALLDIMIALPLLAAQKQTANSVDELIAIHESEAVLFARALQLHTASAEDRAQHKFNRWAQTFSLVGYLGDLCTDLPSDYKSGTVRVKPTVSNRTRIARIVAPHTTALLLTTPRTSMVKLSWMALKNIAER